MYHRVHNRLRRKSVPVSTRWCSTTWPAGAALTLRTVFAVTSLRRRKRRRDKDAELVWRRAVEASRRHLSLLCVP